MKLGDEKFLKEQDHAVSSLKQKTLFEKRFPIPHMARGIHCELIPNVTDADLEAALMKYCKFSGEQIARELGPLPN